MSIHLSTAPSGSVRITDALTLACWMTMPRWVSSPNIRRYPMLGNNACTSLTMPSKSSSEMVEYGNRFQWRIQTLSQEGGGPVFIFLPCWPFSLQSFLLFLPKIRGSGPSPRSVTGFTKPCSRILRATVLSEKRNMCATSLSGGRTPQKMGRGVRPASQNPYPIYE